MKRIKILIATVVLSSLSFVSCSDYLNELPDNRTELNSKEKIAELLVDAYPQRGHSGFTETYSDNVFDTGRGHAENRTNTKNFNWEFDEETGPETPADYWDACYAAVAVANQALASIEELGNEDGQMNALKGEALIARAYAHFQLVSLWSKTYNPNTADTDLGIPYVVEVENTLKKKYKRASVAEVYKNIEADLEEGMKFITNDYKVPSYHFNVNAAKAFAVRFYLNKGEWDKVLDYSSYIGSKPAEGNVIRNMEEFGKLDSTGKMKNYGRSYEKTNLLMVTVNSYFWRDLILEGVRFGLTGKGYEEIYEKQNPYNKGWHFGGISWTNNILVFLPKYYEFFRIENPTAGTGVGYLNYILFSNEEVYLNRMEALVMTNRIDEALDELSYFVGTRTKGYDASTDKLTLASLQAKYPTTPDEFTPFYSISNDQAIALKGILEAKRREFIHEGKRWFDIKRLNIEITHKFADGSTITLPKDDVRRQMAIPLHAVADGIEDNPKK